jgi:hypothetical protein
MTDEKLEVAARRKLPTDQRGSHRAESSKLGAMSAFCLVTPTKPAVRHSQSAMKMMFFGVFTQELARTSVGTLCPAA